MHLENNRSSPSIDKPYELKRVGLPEIGFGTYPFTKATCTRAVKDAIQVGYRLIDTAAYYNNFTAIAKALKGENRHRFYITSKVWHDHQFPDGICKDIDRTLKLLKTDYLDAYLIHWPNSTLPIAPVLNTMKELIQEGKIRHFGLSNVSVNHLKRILEYSTPITWVQVEMHPNFYDRVLLDFCFQYSITVQAWRPLDLGRIYDDKELSNIGKKYDKTACQVALRWILQHGCVPLPGSKNKSHMQENIDVIDFTLSKKEMENINRRAAKGTRFRLKKKRGLGFIDEFDLTYKECWPTG